MATTDERMAQKVAAGRGELERFDAELRVAHLSRLEDRLPESQASSSHHLEMLTTLRQIDFGVTRIARWIQGTDATVTES
jgi:phosphate:Na+ symporter